jgi:hypothetical protein
MRLHWLNCSLPEAERLQWESPGGHSRSPVWLEWRARSQLRGSGGVSPRFPNIPLRAKVDVAQPASDPIAGVGELPVVSHVGHYVKDARSYLLTAKQITHRDIDASQSLSEWCTADLKWCNADRLRLTSVLWSSSAKEVAIMFTSTLCLLQDQMEASDDAIQSLEGDISELHQAYPAIAAVRIVQEQYHRLIVAQTKAIDEIRKLTPATCHGT